MSYCRNNGKNSDVYVIASTRAQSNGRNYQEVWICYCDGAYQAESRKQMIEHLLKHRAKGDKVPQYTLDRLQEEINEE